MKNFITSASLLRTILAERKVPTKKELDIILYTPEGTDNLGKIIYILGIATRYEPNKVNTSKEDLEYFKNFLNACLEAYPIGYDLTEEELKDIISSLYLIDKINNDFSQNKPSEEDVVEIKELALKMLDYAEANADNVVYFVDTFRFATVLVGFAASYYEIYSSILSRCTEFYIEHFTEIQSKYGVLIRV